MASPLAILPLPLSRFRPLAPYCPIGWHLTANPPHRLAPYCSPPAGTLLLLTGWHPTALHRLAPYCYSPAGTLLLIVVGWHPLCPVAPLAHLPLSRLRFTLRSQTSLRLRLIRYCTASLVSPKHRRVAILRSVPTVNRPAPSGD